MLGGVRRSGSARPGSRTALLARGAGAPHPPPTAAATSGCPPPTTWPPPDAGAAVTWPPPPPSRVCPSPPPPRHVSPAPEAPRPAPPRLPCPARRGAAAAMSWLRAAGQRLRQRLRGAEVLRETCRQYPLFCCLLLGLGAATLLLNR